MSFAEALVNKIRVASSNSAGNKSAVLKCLNECATASRIITVALKKTSSTAERNHLMSCIGAIRSCKNSLKFKSMIGFGHETGKPAKTSLKNRVKWEDLQSAFQSRIRTGLIVNVTHKNIKSFLQDSATLFKRRIKNELKKDNAFKVSAILQGKFQVVKGDKQIEDNKHITTDTSPIFQNTNLDEWFTENIQRKLLDRVENFEEKESGWSLSQIVSLMININKYNPLRSGSYIELPSFIQRKKACINVKNNDDACFAWAVVSALYPAQSRIANRTSAYPDPKTVLNLQGIRFPVTVQDIPKFEVFNNVSINVYRLNKLSNSSFKVIPFYITKEKRFQHVNLLMIQDNYLLDSDIGNEDITTTKYHFVWIKNLSRLISSQLSSANAKKIICDRCLHYFHSSKKLNSHEKNCKLLNDTVIPKVPQEDRKIIEFKNFNHKEKTPFIVYADTECLLIPQKDDPSKATQKYQKHEPFSVGYYVKCSYDDTLSYYRSYTGTDCMQWFVKELHDLAENLYTVFLCPLPMEKLSWRKTKEYHNAKACHICGQCFSFNQKKVRDHDHLTGRYRGPAHEDCNLNFQDSHTIPVVFHNLSSYDGSLVITALAETEGRIDVLPVNKEKYISFTKHIPDNFIKFRFIDSFRFLASGLDKLASYLCEYPVLKSQFPDITKEQYTLLTRKGVFPYDYLDNWNRLQEASLPPKSAFYNRLEEREITDEEYSHATNVWNSFGCHSLQDYSDLYMKTDILLLADVFETFCETSLKTYGISPTHSYTLPGYAWQCVLQELTKSKKVKLELLTDIDMILFIERGIRGGLSQCSKRYSEANNKYMPNYNIEKEDTYLMYFDINNQYGWSMSQYLPYGDFKWLPEDEIQKLNVMSVPDDSNEGYILSVDLEIPASLHDHFSDLPPCPNHQKPEGSKDVKLMATLDNKSEYVIHYRHLKQVMQLGVNLKKVHQVLSFAQAPWLKPYIDLNTKLRQAAKNEFEKNFFKLMNNAVFGKTMENIRNHSTVKLITKWSGRYGAEALISRPEFKSVTVFNENLVAVELRKTEIYFNKPIYVGMSILDMAKTTIYDFHYNYMKTRFLDSTILYTDTDSLIYEVRNNDVYDIIKKDCFEYFDTSDYPADNIYGIPQVNKKVLGMMKDESNGVIMTHFVGLRAKMYATKLVTYEDSDDLLDGDTHLVSSKGITKKIKGIKKSVIKNKITFKDYVDCLNNQTENIITQNLIRTVKHQIHSIKQEKIGLSPYDNKRKVYSDCMTTLPYGHYSLTKK